MPFGVQKGKGYKMSKLNKIILKNALIAAGFFMLKDNTHKKGGVVWIEPELVDEMTTEQFDSEVELLLEKINERM